MTTPEIVQHRLHAKVAVVAYIGERVDKLQRAISAAEKQTEAVEETLRGLR